MDADPAFDPTRVMVNGHAIGLITKLVSELRADFREDLGAVEKRLTEKIDEQAGDIDELEEWRKADHDARSRRDGQWSVLRNVATFALRYDKLVLAATLALVGVLAAVLGVSVKVGP